MKKQIVLSLSILVAAISSDSQAAFRRRTEEPVKNQTASAAPSKQQATTSTTTSVPASAEALAQAGITLGDVAEALKDMGVTASGNKTNAAKAQAFITGQSVSGSQNKSHKLGRLSK